MNYPKISIVTPSYNQAHFIIDAIESIVIQKYPNFEHIIIDNQSTDKTIELLKGYKHLPYLKWISETDEGQTDAINKGFKIASGDIIAWLNADDYYLPGTFEVVSEFFNRTQNYDILYGQCMLVDENKKKLRIKKEHIFDYGVLLYYGCYIPSTSTFLKRHIIDEGHFLDSTYRVTMDYEYYVRLSSIGYRFGFLPKTLAAFRWHKRNISVINSEKRREERLRVQHMYGFKITSKYSIQTKLYDLAARFYRIKRWALISKGKFFIHGNSD
ncbi:MAG: glycosyltransferase [Deltaproteobacteria bacterium]|nr:glycosyltransferase [Deltaproteobacteria bacterium]